MSALKIEIPKLNISPENMMPKRCEAEGCKKKLGLSAFSCRCDGYYCIEHRPDMKHGCTYNYKEEYKTYLSTTMNKVTSKKVDNI